MTKLYSNSLALPFLLLVHFARRKGDNSYKKGRKNYNFRIKAGICKRFVGLQNSRIPFLVNILDSETYYLLEKYLTTILFCIQKNN